MSDMYLDGVRVKPMSEPISRAERERWQDYARTKSTIWPHDVTRLLAALEAGDALAEALQVIRDGEEQTSLPNDHTIKLADEALAAWRERVEVEP